MSYTVVAMDKPNTLDSRGINPPLVSRKRDVPGREQHYRGQVFQDEEDLVTGGTSA